MQNAELSELVKTHPQVWSGDRYIRDRSVASTGYLPLDQALPTGGWPPGVIWVDYPRAGIGELQLLYPAMQQLSRERREVVFVNPPYQPYAAAMPGMAFNSTLVVEPENFDDALWAADKLVRHAACGLVLLWTTADKAITSSALRRLNLAARQNGTTLVIYNRLCYPAPAAMWVAAKLRIQVASDGLHIDICKAHGLLHAKSCRINLN